MVNVLGTYAVFYIKLRKAVSILNKLILLFWSVMNNHHHGRTKVNTVINQCYQTLDQISPNLARNKCSIMRWKH